MAATNRRRLLGILVALPMAGVVVPRLARLLPSGWSRPAAAGTSTSRCAACGLTGHTMLASDCPAARHGIV